MRNNISFTLFMICLAGIVHAQNVGIGTINPEHKLDVRTRIDTTLHIKSTGINGLLMTTATRVGILNVMDSATAGSRTGMMTSISFSNSVPGTTYNYIGHDIAFDGFCFPIGSGCNESDIYGLKVDIPNLANDGTHYGIYASAPRLTGYAAYLDGRAYVSKMMGIGTEPNGSQNLFVRVESNPLLPMHRAARFTLIGTTSASVQEAIFAETLGYSSDRNYGGYFKSTAFDGTAYGIYSTAANLTGEESAAVYGNNVSTTGGTRIGVLGEVSANGTGTPIAMRAKVSGSSTNARPVYGIRSSIEHFAGTTAAYGIYTTIDEFATGSPNTYALFAANLNGGYSAFFNGRAKYINGHDASYSGDGYIQLGQTFAPNLVIDDNEILARDDGGEAVLNIQSNGGNLLLCGLNFGAVGIGISNENDLAFGYALSVRGKGMFEELRVELEPAWPDYVFDDGYELLNLQELSAFIDSNGHLPNIPSADDIEKNGLMLGEMQRLMMEKIEELTLHVIRQQEEIDALRDTLNNSN